ncbi:class I SAM-dependent methyltransferase [Oceanirhabdus seepicola]|uniref:Methyltransferase domain-containing protein n=1 Tax=Oceanirhabdus seepicola TaxID=2828781 RepID=A0A9J6P5B4_9CLOT|nr:methyltransferase domain-containing protein [Oceanirhabdus seepicola]MCM1990989.1 methyltransferase domain-containing protein [Oceanirhabdus seepicola]
MKVIIGAGQTNYEGWKTTQECDLNLLSISDWDKLFLKESVDAMIAEHVWEHLTYEEGIEAARNCFKYLKPGGYIRCAVPDKNFRNEWYQNMVQIGGPGPIEHPAATHKIVYDYTTFKRVFETAGFVVTLLEYCDNDGDFHFTYWNENDGKIGRSFRFDTRNSIETLGMVSIIIDAMKPIIIRNK